MLDKVCNLVGKSKSLPSRRMITVKSYDKTMFFIIQNSFNFTRNVSHIGIVYDYAEVGRQSHKVSRG